MVTPSRSEVEGQWRRAVKILQQNYTYGSITATNNFLALADDLEQNLESDYIRDVSNAIASMRSNLAATVSPAVARAIQRPFLRQYCKSVIGRGNPNDDFDMLAELYRYFQDNAFRVQSRVATFNNPSAAGANVGNGQILRLTTDQYNYPIESFFVEAKRARCIRDQSTGTDIGREVFQFKGQTPEPDDLKRSGSGLEALIAGQTADDSLVSNASWSSFGGTAGSDAPTSLTDWTSSVTVNSTNFGIDTTNYLRFAPSDGTTTSYALTVKASCTLSQNISLRGTKLDPNTPYLLAVAWNRSVGSASGTLVLRMGSKATSVTVSAQSGWQITTVPNPIGQACWYRNFAQNDVQIQIDWTKTSGNLTLDDVLFIPGIRFDNHYYWIIPTSATYAQFRRLDEFTWADSVNASTGIIQTWIGRAWNGVYMPSSNGSSITFSDPS